MNVDKKKKFNISNISKKKRSYNDHKNYIRKCQLNDYGPPKKISTVSGGKNSFFCFRHKIGLVENTIFK